MATKPPGTYNFHDWATELLDRIGAPHTGQNYAFLTAWANREGTAAQNNPLGTTQDAPGATTFNSVGVKNYPTAKEGAAATYAALNNGLYNDLLAALRSGKPSLTRSYRGLHSWSAGPNGAAAKGYWNLKGVDFVDPPKGSDQSGAIGAAGDTLVGCDHELKLKLPLYPDQSICMDKPIAILAFTAGGFLLFTGVAVIMVSTLGRTRLGQNAASVAKYTPAGVAVKAAAAQGARRNAKAASAAKASSAAEAAQTRRNAETRRAVSHQAAETRRAEAHTAEQRRRATAARSDTARRNRIARADVEYRQARATATRSRAARATAAPSRHRVSASSTARGRYRDPDF